jgi:hemoglobin
MTKFSCPATCAPAMAETISPYEAIGGRAALVAAVTDFYRRLLADPVLGPLFPGGIGVRHRAYVVSILGEALGGPKRYGGEMVGARRGLGISAAHCDRAAARLAAALVQLSIPRHLTGPIVAILAGPRPASAALGYR